MQTTSFIINKIKNELYYPTLSSKASITTAEGTPLLTAIAPSIPVIRRSTHEEKKHRGKNFEKKEDVQLVNAYLITSKDPEISSDQSLDKFWVRVWSKYTEDGNEKERDPIALRNRFHTQISPSCSIFSSSMSLVLTCPKNDENEADQVIISQ